MHASAAMRVKNAAGRVPSVSAAAAVVVCAFCGSAQAQVTIGQLAPQPVNSCPAGQFDVLPVGLPASEYAAPSAGLITDLIGIDYEASLGPFACSFGAAGSGSATGTAAGDAALGSLTLSAETKPNVSAAFLAAPTVVGVSPAGGTIAGGTRVTVTGANFAEVKGVSFGETPAVSFEVESETQIAAVSPASGTLGDTTVTVTTAAGNAAGTFTYRGCLVPRLRGVGLSRAKALLRKAGCRLGRLIARRRKTARRGRVIGQSPRPATVLAPGAKVSVVLR
jgi:hypothetical protein